jgi:hypothetical protein
MPRSIQQRVKRPRYIPDEEKDERHILLEKMRAQRVLAWCTTQYWSWMESMCLHHIGEGKSMPEGGIDALHQQFHDVCVKRRDDYARDHLAIEFRPHPIPRHVQEMFSDTSAPSDEPTLGLELKHIKDNQYSLGGHTACTSISFVVAAAMRDYKNAQKAINTIDWARMMKIGIRLWHLWLEDNNLTTGFQTLEQIRCMEVMKEHFHNLGGAPTEWGGRIDGSPAYPIHNKEQLDEYQVTFPGLHEALRQLCSKGCGSVGILTIGHSTISLWSAGISKKEMILFDSHGTLSPSLHSTIAFCTDLDTALTVALKMCGGSTCYRVGSQDTAFTYCMYAFDPKKTV